MEGTTETITAATAAAETPASEPRESTSASKAPTMDSEAISSDGNSGTHTGKKSDASPTKRRRVVEVTPREPIEINLRSLLQAGAHFGHQTSRWSPKMAPYIYSSRNGIHIIDLPKAIQKWREARKAIVEVASRGGNILFVGTKKQAEKAIVEEATRCGQYYVARRWLGGMMTNFQTIRKSIERLGKLEQTLDDEDKAIKEGSGAKFTKKERLMMTREIEKLEYSLSGIRDMYAPPQLMFIVDIKREDIALKEAQRLDIPVVALVDTNCNPDLVEHAIPSNDDGSRAIALFAGAVSDAILEGKKLYAQRPRPVAQARNLEVKSEQPPKEKKTKKATAKKTVEAKPDTESPLEVSEGESSVES